MCRTKKNIPEEINILNENNNNKNKEKSKEENKEKSKEENKENSDNESDNNNLQNIQGYFLKSTKTIMTAKSFLNTSNNSQSPTLRNGKKIKKQK